MASQARLLAVDFKQRHLAALDRLGTAATAKGAGGGSTNTAAPIGGSGPNSAALNSAIGASAAGLALRAGQPPAQATPAPALAPAQPQLPPPLLMKRIIDQCLLGQSAQSKTMEEIRSECGIDLALPENQPVVQLLRNHERILYEPATGRYRYRAKYSLASREDLLRLVQTRSPRQVPYGIDLEELKDAYRQVERDAAELAAEGRILCVENEDSHHKILYPAPAKMQVELSSRVVDMWHKVKIPDSVELEKQLRDANINRQNQTVYIPKRPAKKQRTNSQPSMPRILQNSHMIGLAGRASASASASGSASASASAAAAASAAASTVSGAQKAFALPGK